MDNHTCSYVKYQGNKYRGGQVSSIGEKDSLSREADCGGKIGPGGEKEMQ